jgi:ribosomal protein L16 Arg81 hydroxylase
MIHSLVFTANLVIVTLLPIFGLISPTAQPFFINKTIDICEESNSVITFDEIERILPSIIDQVTSIEELDTWLKSQECVQSVKLRDFLIKTNPPQREFVVEFKNSNGSTITRVIKIFVLETGQFRFNRMQEL